ncbi:MAG: hypothetical protein LQ345_001898 [Seirophora villosa]|nr:MAG: hypothetical protein LQ345_001898 [Seirophora villosa]
MANPPTLPSFKDLPLHPEDPPHSAWGLYGRHDQLGTLNRLTDKLVADAARDEIKHGKSVCPHLAVTDCTDPDDFCKGDGLRHFAYQSEQKFYNAWAKRGIVGRGILLDFHTWRLANNVAYKPFETGSISLEQLQAVLNTQGTKVHFGDVLFIRSGYLDGYNRLPQDEIEQFATVVPPHLSGVEQSEEVLEWIWNNFSAVAGDQPSFECWPTRKEWALHEVLLAGFGMPIGELFDLEELANYCKTSNRWSFFLTSEVCNVPGGVASPANALAIF